MTTSSPTPSPSLPGEHDDLLHALAEQRTLLLITVRGITDAQAAERTTVSELTLGGILKHLTQGEQVWAQIMSKGDGELPDGMLDLEQYRMVDGETLAGLLEQYAAAARRTEASVAALPDLGRSVPLPKTPWSPPETVHWSARRILLHLIRETAQHAGHADIIREALDGASTTAQRN
ncbi:DinB family protein [Streptomyces sp. NPDC101152]|uniref:DinB family protein n=1 Tax=Streptomyces sp. NPDC101152 TaxID=3366116 RepID=UPI00380D4EFD